MRLSFLSNYNILYALPQNHNIVYTDGSLREDGRAGAGVVFYMENGKMEHRILHTRSSNLYSTTKMSLGTALAKTSIK